MSETYNQCSIDSLGEHDYGDYGDDECCVLCGRVREGESK